MTAFTVFIVIVRSMVFITPAKILRSGAHIYPDKNR